MLKKTVFAILLVVAACVTSYPQQDESKRPSPAAKAQCKFSGGKTITVDYSSPRMRGRKIFGELVPYGEVTCPPVVTQSSRFRILTSGR